MRIKIEKIPNPILKNSYPLKLLAKDFLWAYHPCVLERKGNYYMFYTGRSFSKNISHYLLLAKSSDLKNWTKLNKPILENGKRGSWDSDFLAHGFFFKDNDRYFMLYDGSRKGRWLEEIGLAESRDLIHWEKYKNNPIFKVGRNSWEKRHVSRCCVYKEKGIYYLFYAGHDGKRERIGLVRGKSIYKLERFLRKPVLDVGEKGEWDGRSISDPRVIKHKGKYLMFYSGIDAKGMERVGLSESKDLINWSKFAKNPILDVSQSSWDKVSATRADIKRIDNSFYIFYSGKKKLLYNIGMAKLNIL